MIDGVILTAPKVIEHPLGSIHRFIRQGEPGFHGFGECYFTEVVQGKTKGWKKHFKMYLNLVVISGEVKFVIFDDRDDSATKNKFMEVILSKDKNYQRLTVPPGVWMAFHGVGEKNILMNFAQIEHDPAEGTNKDLKDIPYAF